MLATETDRYVDVVDSLTVIGFMKIYLYRRIILVYGGKHPVFKVFSHGWTHY